MKLSKVLLLTALPIVLALSGCATTEENAAATPVTAPVAAAPTSPAIAPVAAPVNAAPESVDAAHCANHKAASEAKKHDCVQHCKKAKGKKGKACLTHCEQEAMSQHNCQRTANCHQAPLIFAAALVHQSGHGAAAGV